MHPARSQRHDASFPASARAAPAAALNTGILFAHLKPRRRAQAQRRPGDRRVAAQARRPFPGMHGVPAESAADPDRRASSPKRSTRSRCRAPTRDELYKYAPILEAQNAVDARADATSTATCRSTIRRSTSISIATRRTRSASRPDRSRTRSYSAYGARQISTIYAPNDEYWVILEVEPQYQADPATLALLYVRSHDWPTGAARHRRASLQRTLGPLAVNHFGPAARGHHLVQPRARRLARQGARRREDGSPTTPLPATVTTSLPGHRAGVPVFDAQPRDAAGDGDPGHLHRAGHSLRELHPSDHDSLGLAVGRLRRAADPDGLSAWSSTCSPSSASSCWSAW